MDWRLETNKEGTPVAILRDRKITVVKVYASPDGRVVRIVLPEFTNAKQCVAEWHGPGGYIDFTRSARNAATVQNTLGGERNKQGETTNGKVQQP